MGKEKHGLSKTKVYKTFHGMKQRCYNPNNPEYKYYGGRGIAICPEWLNDVSEFCKWAYENGFDESKARDEQTIDRIDVNGNYCPENCRIIPMSEQFFNRTDTHYITVNGETKTIKEWSNIYGVPMSLINYRINSGWSAEDAVSKEVKAMRERRGKITFNGKTQSLQDWANELGINAGVLSNRINKYGWSIEKAFSEPVRECKRLTIDESEYPSICKRYLSGERMKEIADSYNVTINPISRIIRVSGIAKRHRFREYDIDSSVLLEELREGKRNKELAEKYGCSESNISTRKMMFKKEGLL